MSDSTPSGPAPATESTLKHLAFDLREVYELLDGLCAHLAGGGIVQARDIETSVARAMPKVKRAVTALNAIDAIADHGETPRRN